MRARLQGRLALPRQPGYELTQRFNTAVTMRPQAVIAAVTHADIVQTVRFAAARGLRVAVQCTGHGAVPTAGDDVLLIHTVQLDELRIEPDARRARIGAG